VGTYILMGHIVTTNTTMLMFIGLNKTTKKTWVCKRKIAWERIKSYVLKQTYFSVDKNAIALKYFDLSTSAAWRF
jgi:hypothetical protein